MAHAPILTPVPRTRSARPAAFWLAGTGALLLLAAAGVLVALQWDDIAAWAKLVGLVAVNAGVVAAGLHFRSAVPATARALHHLGALLIPVSVVAATIQLGLAWEWILLSGTVLGAAGIAVLDRLWSSAVLEGVAAAAVIPFAGAVAALTPIPPSFVLAAAALVGATLAPRTNSIWWAATIVSASLAPSLALVAGVDDPLIATSDIANALGLTGAVAAWTHLVAGIASGVAMGMLARRDEDVALALGAISLPIIGAAIWLTESAPGGVGILSAAVLGLVAFEIAGVSLAKGSFSQRVVTSILPGVEVLLAIATFWVFVYATDAGDAGSPLGSIAAAMTASVVAAVGWALADHRRRVDDCQSLPMALATGSGWWPATVGIAASVLAGAIALDLGVVTTVAVVLALAAALAASGRGGAHSVAAALTIGAVGVSVLANAWDGLGAGVPSDAEVAAITVAASFVLAWSASMRGPRGDLGAMVLAAAGVMMMPLAVAAAASDERIEDFLGRLESTAFWWTVAVLVATGMIALTERLSSDPIATRTAIPARVLLVAPFVAAFLGSASTDVLPAALLLGALVALDTWRTGDVRLAGPLVIGTIVLLATVAHESLGYAASVPTWTWLAIGGITLLGAGVAVERGATTPVESARRTVTTVCADFR